MASIASRILKTPTLSSSTDPFQKLPYELMFIISEYAGAPITNYAATNKSSYEFVSECADHYSTKYHTALIPISSDNLSRMILETYPKLFSKWGRQFTSLTKEVYLLDAVERGDVSRLKHVISMGVDLNTRTACKPIKPDRAGSLFPVQIATANNDYEVLKLLLDHGADYNPMLNYCERWFLDGYTDLLSSYSVPEIRDDIRLLILNEYIANKDFAPFFNNSWRSENSLFNVFCTALESLDNQIVDTGYASSCSKMECGRWCQSVHLLNGHFFCPECASKSEVPPIGTDKGKQKLWIEPEEDDWDDDATIIYDSDGDIDIDIDNDSIGTYYAEDYDEQDWGDYLDLLNAESDW
jgi:hypothetical protein